MAAVKANWLHAAMTDDNLVAELLLRLHRPDSRRAKPSLSLPPLHWGFRQRRSKSSASASAACLKKENESSMRRSPTTPLSWTASGAASPGNSFEESSRPLVLAPRFKGSATTDTTKSVSASKRSRRKRTMAELKEAESSLLQDREHLKKQIESLHMKLKEQRLFNESLKRIKIDLHAQSVIANGQMGPNNNYGEPERKASTSKAPSNVSQKITIVEQQPQSFVLPDLNMTPESILEMS